jgi:hypothetical protein
VEANCYLSFAKTTSGFELQCDLTRPCSERRRVASLSDVLDLTLPLGAAPFERAKPKGAVVVFRSKHFVTHIKTEEPHPYKPKGEAPEPNPSEVTTR